MTTWTIKAAKPEKADTGASLTAPADTGLRFDDSVALANFLPVGSTVNIQIAKMLSDLTRGLTEAVYIDGGWVLVADDGAGTVIWPNRDGQS